MKYRAKRDWAHSNQKLKQIAKIDFFISEDAIKKWHDVGQRKSGGKKIYSDHAIEMCLIIKEYYKRAYRQAQGFITSIFQAMNIQVPIPDYSTLSRRCGALQIALRNKCLSVHRGEQPLVVAVDSTGLSLISGTEWNRIKHKNAKAHTKWRKLHIAIDTKTGEILSRDYSVATVTDGQRLPQLLEAIEAPVSAVAGDMAYDKVNCREAIQKKKAKQLIPLIRKARLSHDNRNMANQHEILEERDEAIRFIQHNTINGNSTLARACWKHLVGYHVRSLVETTMLQIKQHCGDRLTNRTKSHHASAYKMQNYKSNHRCLIFLQGELFLFWPPCNNTD